MAYLNGIRREPVNGCAHIFGSPRNPLMDAKLPGSDMRYFAQNVVSRTWQVCLPASFAKSHILLHFIVSKRKTWFLTGHEG